MRMGGCFLSTRLSVAWSPYFFHVNFMEFRELYMNGIVLGRLMELGDTPVEKLDKGLVEDTDYRFRQRAWSKFDEFLHGDGVIFGLCYHSWARFVEEKWSQCWSWPF